jgi:hypothetical protein
MLGYELTGAIRDRLRDQDSSMSPVKVLDKNSSVVYVVTDIVYDADADVSYLIVQEDECV